MRGDLCGALTLGKSTRMLGSWFEGSRRNAENVKPSLSESCRALAGSGRQVDMDQKCGNSSLDFKRTHDILLLKCERLVV